MGKTFAESQEELMKAFAASETETDEIDELERDGVNALRERAGAAPIGKAMDHGDDDPLDELTETEYMDADEVYGMLVKSASGDLEMLIEGETVISELMKSLSAAHGATNESVAANTVLIKALSHNQTLQNRALVATARKMDYLINLIESMPVSKSQRGAGYAPSNRRLQTPPEFDDTAITKAAGCSASPVGRYGGMLPDDLAVEVKKAYDDPEKRKLFGLKPDHLQVRKSGLGRLPKRFVQHLIEEGLVETDGAV